MSLEDRFEQFIDGLVNTECNKRRTDFSVKPGNAKSFPAKNVGDLLYACCDNSRVRRYIVTAKKQNGDVLIAPVDDFESGYYVSYACDFHYGTLEEALMEEANSELNYSQPRLEWANKVLKAIARGEDLTSFMEGIEE